MGAWDFGRYRYVKGDRMGKVADDTDREQVRLNRAIRSFQRRLAAMEYDPGRTDGVFGYFTHRAVKAFQADHGLDTDGQVGRATSEAMLRQKIGLTARYYGGTIQDGEDHTERLRTYLAGMVAQESGFDPAAIGSEHPEDWGLVQINTEVHDTPGAWAPFDAVFALRWGCERLRNRFEVFRTMTLVDDDLAWTCAIAGHNSPADAQEWAETGQPPDEQIEQYVANVKAYGADYWEGFE